MALLDGILTWRRFGVYVPLQEVLIMRTPPVILLTLTSLLSCGAPLPGDGQPGQAGQTGGAGAQGPPGRDGRDAVTAGTRLRPLWLVGADGSRAAAVGSFWDTERRERCQMRAVDGAEGTVCAPALAMITPTTADQYVRFSMQQ